MNTSVTGNAEPPPGYVPPANPIIEEKPKVDPMEGMNGALDMVSRVANLFGGGLGGMDPVELRKLESMAYDQGQRAGLTEGRYQAEREHRKELEDLRDLPAPRHWMKGCLGTSTHRMNPAKRPRTNGFNPT